MALDLLSSRAVSRETSWSLVDGAHFSGLMDSRG